MVVLLRGRHGDLMGVAILGAWAYKVSHDAGSTRPPMPPRAQTSAVSSRRPKNELVGRITGTADCRWADPQDAPSAAVPLGRKYELASGLMEITYQTGAKVILQGPCTYEVDSAAGGFLSLGKLTARVEKSGIRGPESEGSDHYPQSPIHYPLFSVRTPTAVVTDLGTEFGVEVDKSGTCEVHVLKGQVEAESLRPGGREVPGVKLREGQARQFQRATGQATAVPISGRNSKTMYPVHPESRQQRWAAYSRKCGRTPA